MPPMTKVRKICPSTGMVGNKTAPPSPQHMPASSDPQVARHDHWATSVTPGCKRRYRSHNAQRPLVTSRTTQSQASGRAKPCELLQYDERYSCIDGIDSERDRHLPKNGAQLRATNFAEDLVGPRFQAEKSPHLPFPRAPEECGSAATEPPAVLGWSKDIPGRRPPGEREIKVLFVLAVQHAAMPRAPWFRATD